MNYTIAAEIEFIHREHVFGIIVGNSKVCSEFAFFGFIRCQHIADLNIYPFAVFIANKINFAVTDLSNAHLGICLGFPFSASCWFITWLVLGPQGPSPECSSATLWWGGLSAAMALASPAHQSGSSCLEEQHCGPSELSTKLPSLPPSGKD